MSMFQKISSTLEFSRDPEICITSNLVWNGKKLRFRGCSWLGGYFAKAKVWEGYVLMFLHENMEESSCDFLPKCIWSEDLDRILKSEGQLVAGSCLPFQKMPHLFLAAFFQARNQSVVVIAQSAHGMDAANRWPGPMSWSLYGGKDAECLPWHVARNFGWNIQFIQYMRPTACRIAGIAVKWLDAWQVWLHGSGVKKKHRGYQQLCQRWSFWGFTRIHGIMGYNQSADFFLNKDYGWLNSVD